VQAGSFGSAVRKLRAPVPSKTIDVGISDAREKRVAPDRLIAGAHRRRFDAVVVGKFVKSPSDGETSLKEALISERESRSAC